MQTYKGVIVGDAFVGKTSFLITYSTNIFPSDYIPTLGHEYLMNEMIDGNPISLVFWDTAGQEEYDKLRPLIYPGTDILLVCFSISSPTSFENISARWKPEITQHIPNAPFILVGTKLDLRNDKETVAELRDKFMTPISFEQGIQKAKEINALKYLECSALTQEGVKNVFAEVFQALIAHSAPTAKKERACCLM